MIRSSWNASWHCKLEAWLLNGYSPDSDGEQELYDSERAELGFCPVVKAEQLSAKNDTAKKSAKRVLNRLTNDDAERRKQCWEETSLDTLRSNGANTRLASFLDQIEAELQPLIGR